MTTRSLLGRAVLPLAAVLLTAVSPAPAQGIKPTLVLPLGHTDEVRAVAYSPDGKTVLTAGEDKIARLWDVASGKPIAKFEEHTSTINAVAYAPVDKTVATASSDGTVKLWDMATGRCEASFKDQRNNSYMYAVAFSPDGKTLLAGLGDNSAILWDVGTGNLVRKFASNTNGHTGYVKAVAFAPDGKTLFTASADKTIKQWDVKTGRTLQTFSGHTYEVNSVAVSPDGKTLLTASSDRTARVWDIATAKEMKQFAGHSDYVYQAVFSPDGKTVLTASADRFAALWDVETKKLVHSYSGHTGYVYGVAFSPDGKTVLTGSGDATARLHALPTAQAQEAWKAHTSRVNAVAFSPDGKAVVSGSDDYTVKLWDATKGKLIRELAKHNGTVKGVAFTADGKRVLTGSTDNTAVLWDLEGKPAQSFLKHTDYVNAVAISADGKRVLTGSGDKTACVWDADTGKALVTFSEHKGYVRAVALSRDGKTAASADESEYGVRVWDTATGKELHELKGHTGTVYSVAFAPDGKTLLTGSSDYTVRLWDVASGTCLRAMKHDGTVNAVAFGPDGRRAVSTGGNSRVKVWDLTTGTAVNTLRLQAEFGASVAFSPDGQRVAVGVSNYAVVLWDVDVGRTKAVLAKTADTIRTVALNTDPDDLMVATGNTGRLWELDTGNSMVSTVQNRPILTEFVTENKKLHLKVAPDGTARLSDGAGVELCTIVTLGDGADWLVATPEGLFDGSASGREMVAFRVGQSVVPVERFHRDFYYPGLLNALVKGERPKPNVTVAAKPAPTLRLVAPAENTTGTIEVTVEATDQGGGVASLAVYHQGTRIFLPGAAKVDGKVHRRTFPVKLVEGVNHLEVRASGDGGWESEPARGTVVYATPVVKPNLYVLAVGLSKYANGKFNLDYAAADAKALGGVFENRGGQLYGQVVVKYLLDRDATGEGIRTALEEIGKKAHPRDTLVFTVSGHGTTLGQRYFFLPHEFDDTKFPTVEQNVKAQGVSVDDLGELLSRVPATKKMVVLDTCGSGGATGLVQKGKNPFAFRGEIDRMIRTQGVFIIAACAADQQAQEVKELEHGVLTYTLLAGLGVQGLKEPKAWSLKGKDAGGGKPVVDVLDLFTFASTGARDLMKQNFDREQDVHQSTAGSSFPLLPVKDK